jgi:hypothetical protein
MARRVEVLQIEGVVPRLVVVGDTELTLAALELDRKDGRPRNQHGVDSAPKSWDVKLQKDRATQSTQSIAKNIDFLLPCLALIDIEVMGVGRYEDAEDMVWIRGEETGDRS